MVDSRIISPSFKSMEHQVLLALAVIKIRALMIADIIEVLMKESNFTNRNNTHH